MTCRKLSYRTSHLTLQVGKLRHTLEQHLPEVFAELVPLPPSSGHRFYRGAGGQGCGG